MSTEKIRPTPKDVIHALRKEVGDGLRAKPQSASELERSISSSYGHMDWDRPQVHRPTLNTVLAELSADFSIIKRSGKEWGSLPPSLHGMADRFCYYALPEHLEEWKRAGLNRIERKRQVLAESLAKDALAEQFPAEYQVLVRRELKKAKQTMKAPE